MVLSVKFFDGSNVPECPTFEIKLFTLTVHNLSVAAHLRSFFEKVGSFALLFIAYICAHTFHR